MKGIDLPVERVLIVDDDAELYQLVTRFLSREGFATSWAPNGAAGVERALAEDYSLIMLDVMMPDTDGFDVLAPYGGAARRWISPPWNSIFSRC